MIFYYPNKLALKSELGRLLLSLREVAEIIGVSYNTIKHYSCYGFSEPAYKKMIKMTDIDEEKLRTRKRRMTNEQHEQYVISRRSLG